MKYDAIQAEKDWRAKPASRGPRKTAKQKHAFPHMLVHRELGNVLLNTGCNAASSVLCIGCGPGSDMDYVCPVSANITGIDVSPKAVLSFNRRGCNGIIADAKTLPFMNESFDYVICPAVLHHLIGQGDLMDYTDECVRVIRPRGYLIALEPNVFSLSGMTMNVANSLKPGLTGLVPHERALSPFSLMKYYRRSGLLDVRCCAASYTWNRFPLWVSKLISRYEGRVRHMKPFCYLGWFMIVAGRKPLRSS